MTALYFNSFAFLAFFPCFFVAYWMLRGTSRLVWCLAGSYLFYGLWDYRFLGLIALSTIVDYAIGLALPNATSQRRRRRLLATSVIFNLGVLAVFKYLNFFAESLQELIAPLGWTLDWSTLHIILPAGISFYTFQTLSYSIDVYRGQLQPEPSILRFATFVSFFPQLVAGPIVRAGEFLPQLQTDRLFCWNQFESGFGRVIQGFFKKIVIADSIAIVADPLFVEPGAFSAINAIVLVVLYAFQVYCDFSGYSDIAIGLAKMLGFELPENFRFPYFATSPADFWHRWHITLSTWLRDYLYIPLGGSRQGQWLTYRNLTITMLLGGLWHGASWNFVIWGAIHGVLLILHRAWCGVRVAPSHRAWLRPPIQFLITAFKVAAMFTVICVTWVFFRSGTFAQAVEILSKIASLDDLSPGSLQNKVALFKALAMVALFIAFEGASQVVRWPELFARVPIARGVYYASVLWVIALTGTFNGTQFIYFQF